MMSRQGKQEEQSAEKGGTRKSPALASVFSALIPGLGQVYCGERMRGLILLVAVVVLSALIRWRETDLLYGGIIILWLWNIWDAYNLAKGVQIAAIVGFLLIAGITYAIGWGVTGIKLGKLFTEVADVKPLVLDLLQPDVFERDKELQVASADFESPCSDSPRALSTPDEQEPYLILDKACGDPGEEFVMRAGNLWPGSRGQIWYVPERGTAQGYRIRHGGQWLKFTTDEEGKFWLIGSVPPTPHEALEAGPEMYYVEARLEREVGPPRLSETFFLVLEKIIETVFLALMATTLGIFVAVPISFMAARNLMGVHPVTMVIYYVVRTILNILRSIEPLIMAIVFVVWVGLGPFAGVMALAVHSVAALGKLYSEQVESIDPGPIEAIRATGANRFQTIVYGVVPQIVPPYIAFTIYRWDINVRMSTIIGFVGGGGIGFLLQQWIRLLDYNAAGTAVWAIAIVVATMDYASAIVRERVV
jgi:phosphonate transport system permease protein